MAGSTVEKPTPVPFAPAESTHQHSMRLLLYIGKVKTKEGLATGVIAELAERNNRSNKHNKK